MAKRYDVIIIGAGPGGMTAALYASRANLSVLMIDRGIYGGQMNNTGDIENYPGFELVTGPDLAEKMYASSTKFGAEYGYGTVESIEDKGDYKLVKTDETEYETKTVVIATGAEHKHVGISGEEEFSGTGVSYCAVCDAAFFRNRDVVVIGGGDSALEEGLYLTQVVDKVTVIHRRDEFRAQPIIQQRARANDKMEFVMDAGVKEILGDKNVTGVSYVDHKTGEEHVVPAGGVFIYVGIKPMTDAFKSLGILDEEGWIKTDEKMRTKVPGIFAIGDVRADQLRQIATAVGDGGIAGQQVYQYLIDHNEI